MSLLTLYRLKSMHRLVSSISFLFLLIVSAVAQGLPVSNEIITKKNGLSDNYVSGGIVQDKHGYIWIGTADGLNRYDGIDFKIYKPIPYDSTSLQEPIIRCMYTDRKGRLWVKGDNLNLFDYNTERFIQYPVPSVKNKMMSQFKKMADDSKGNIWCQFNNDLDGILLLNPSTHKYKNLMSFSGKKIDLPAGAICISLITVDADDNIWFAVEDRQRNVSLVKVLIENDFIKEVKWFTGISSRHKNRSRSYGFVTCLPYKDPVFAFENGDFFRYNKKEGRIVPDTIIKSLAHELNDHEIMNVITDFRGKIWILTYKEGVSVFDGKTLRPMQVNLSSNNVIDFYLDHSGILWVATQMGLNKVSINPKNFHSIVNKPGVQQSIPDNYIFTLLVTRGNKLWVATQKGLSEVDIRCNQYRNFSENLMSRPHIMVGNYYNTLLEYTDGTLLCGAVGLNRIAPFNGIFQYSHPDTSDRTSINDWVVWKLHKGKVTGNYYLATRNGCCRMIPSGIQPQASGVLQKMPEKFDRFFYNEYEVASDASVCFDIYEDSKGFLWISSINGLHRYEPGTKRIYNYYYQQKNSRSLNAVTTSCIFEDSKNRIWIGTEGGGLNLYHPETDDFTHITSREGLASDVVWGVLEDKRGILWISTTNGLSRYNTVTNSFTNFDEYDGLPDREFLRNAYAQGSDGRMYFGTTGGVVHFDPDSIMLSSEYPRIVINSLFLFNSPVSVGEVINGDTVLKASLAEQKRIVLSHKNNVVSIGFSALHYVAPQKNKCSYKLEGFDTDWNFTNSHYKMAHYTNLEPGTYKFRVRAANSDGIWNPDEAILEIEVLPSFWQTWWFKTMMITGGILLLLFLANYFITEYQKVRLQRAVAQKTNELNRQNTELEKLNETKDKFIYIIGHDLKNPFQAISGMSELLVKAYHNTPDDHKIEMLKVIEKASKSATDLLENLLLWARSQTGNLTYNCEKFDLYEVVLTTYEMLRVHAERKDIKMVNMLEPETIVVADKNMIKTVIRNLISNAIKFTNAKGKIEIFTHYTGPHLLTVCIKDDGIGMNDDMKEKLFRIDIHHEARGTEGETGTGLGLIISKEFLELNGSKLTYESQPGKGTTFFFTLHC